MSWDKIFVVAAWSALVLLPCRAGAGEIQLVASYGTWRYLDDGSDGGTVWRTPAFDDSAWTSGEAQLGYGDGDEITLVRCRAGMALGEPCTGSADRSITTYFRRPFLVEDAAGLSALTLRLLVDDGAVVYLNGVEALRQNMPAGDVLVDTLALGPPADENAFVEHALAPGLLADGNNVVAVEVHQRLPSSSDVSFALELVATHPSLAQLVRGPYLQQISPTAAMVRWRTAAPAASRLEVGLAPDLLATVTYDPLLRTEHEVPVNGLQPSTQYFYAVGDETGRLAGADEERAFTTPPLPGTRTPRRVWVIGDSGSANANAAAVRDAYRHFLAFGTSTDLWLMLGDNAYPSGTDTQYQAAVFDMYPTFLERAGLWPAIGNHDALSFSGGGGPYFDMFTLPAAGEAGGLPSGTESYYSFDDANVHYVVLDSQTLSGLQPASPMLQWLAADLAATAQDWIVAAFHHPPYSHGSHNSDNASDSGGRLRDVRENVLPVLEAYGVDLVLAGHSHAYERSFYLDGHYDTSGTLAPSMIVDGGDGRPAGDGSYTKRAPGEPGAVYAVAGSSGTVGGGTLDHPVMVVSLAALGSLVLDVDGWHLQATFVGADGSLADTFVIDKEPFLFADGFESGDTDAWSFSTGL